MKKLFDVQNSTVWITSYIIRCYITMFEQENYILFNSFLIQSSAELKQDLFINDNKPCIIPSFTHCHWYTILLTKQPSIKCLIFNTLSNEYVEIDPQPKTWECGYRCCESIKRTVNIQPDDLLKDEMKQKKQFDNYNFQ